MCDSPRCNALMQMTREQLHVCATHYYKRGGTTAPDVMVVASGGMTAVFKDYGTARRWFGRFVAPVLLAREASALSALDDLAGVPRLYRRVDARGLLIEHCPATAWPLARAGDAAYGRLDDLIQAMHARGIAHADLRGGGNILVDEKDQPYLVDFVSRIRRGRPWNAPQNWLFRQFVAVDESALAKLRVRYAQHLATPADYARRYPGTRLAWLARRMRASLRRRLRCLNAGH